MHEEHVQIKTPEGTMPTFICWPDVADGPFPAIVFYMDAPAIREELYDMARRKAAEGFFVILPDLFYRFGHIRFPFRNPKTRAVWQACMANISNAEVMDDTRAMLDFMAGHAAVKAGPKACIGYCMSGRLITAAAGVFADDFAVAASLYGVGIVTSKDDSAHFHVKDIRGEMYYCFAETDSTVPAYVVPTLQAELDTHGIRHTLEVLPGTEHGFCFPERDVYNHAAAEHVFHHFIDACRRHLT